MGLYYIVFAALLHVALSQGPQVPPKCRGPPHGVKDGHECCKIPPFFSEEELSECGFQKLGEGPPEPDQPGLPHGPPDMPSANDNIIDKTNKTLPSHRRRRGQGRKRRCTKQQCILNKHNLMSESGEVDQAAVTAFIDTWSEANPDFKPAIDIAKERCLGKDLPGPPHVCEANKLVFCIASTLYMECPAWDDREGCDIMKEHITECKKYFVQE